MATGQRQVFFRKRQRMEQHDPQSPHQSDDAPGVQAESGLVVGGVESTAPSGGAVRWAKPRPPKLYRIGEVVEYSGVSRQTIHNYTTMGLLVESRWTNGGHRLYDETAFERLDEIAELKSQHKSMEHIREHFVRAKGPAPQGGL